MCYYFSFRHLLSCLSATGSVSTLADEVYAHHAPIIVTAWLEAALSLASDASLLADLGTLAGMLCHAQPQIADMLAEALIMSCYSGGEQPAGGTSAVVATGGLLGGGTHGVMLIGWVLVLKVH